MTLPAALPTEEERIEIARSIDLRLIAWHERRRRVFSVFDGMPDGSVLHLVSDDDLRPLRHELERLRPFRSAWFQTKQDGVHWESFIRRIPVPSRAAGAAPALKRTWLFSKTSDERVTALCAGAHYLEIRRGRAFVEQGLAFPYFGTIVRGLVQGSVIAPNAKEIVLHDRLPGDVFGEDILLNTGTSAMRYVARTDDTIVVLLAAADVWAEFAIDAAPARTLSVLLSENNRALIERLSALSAQPVVARLACALLAYADFREGLNSAIGPLSQMRQAELAAMAGTGNAVISRALRQLESDGALQRKAGQIVALSRRKLVRFAQMTKY